MADPGWPNVVLLLHCDGSDGSPTFTDSSSSAHTVTAHGDAQVDTSDKKFGTGSAQLDGTGDYLSIPDSDDWAFGEDPLTIDVFHKFSSTPGTEEYQALVAVYQDANNWWELYYDDSGVYFDYVFSGATQVSLAATTTPDTTTWHMVSLDWYDGTLTLFLDGAVADSATYGSGIAGLSGSLYLGSWNGTDDLFTGRLDEIRINKGLSRYEGTAFTPPTEAFPEGFGVFPATGALKFTGKAPTVEKAIPDISPSPGVISLTGRAPTLRQNVYSGGALSINIDSRPRINKGLPIVIRPTASAGPFTLTIDVGTYPVSASLPIAFRLYQAAGAIALPITIYGDLTAAASAASVKWRPKVVIDGVDFSARLVGTVRVEREEGSSPIASFSFLPADGTVDPLAWVGKTARVYWQKLVAGVVTNEHLRFTGVVSDPTWNPDVRMVQISATGDLQSIVDRMSKAEIASTLASAAPTFSEYVFGDPDDMTGWDYSEALLSTTPHVIWQDAGGIIRTTSVVAKVSADFTFDETNIIDSSLDLRFQNRMALTNRIVVRVAYRFRRKRQRHIRVSWNPWQLQTPSMYLSGNMGGWDLPQRSMIASAADGGGWSVIGDITYRDVWPNGFYSSYSDGGTPIMIGLNRASSVSAEECIGASWVAGRRWLQTVTEQYELTVNASESQGVIGVLAKDVSYSIEDETDDETWETDTNFSGYASGATLMANGLDYKIDMDELRDAMEAAQEVALAKARNEILKSHRGTTVTWTSLFQPMLDLSHTAAVDTTWLEAQGKVSRIADVWDMDTGECISEIDIAVSRHNGAGLTSDDPLTAPDTPDDPDETSPAKYIQLGMYIGGQTTQPEWDDDWTGYICNLPYIETYTGDIGGWSRDRSNPALANRVYDEGFHVRYPTVDAAYVDPADTTGASSYEVAIPEDTLVITSG